MTGISLFLIGAVAVSNIGFIAYLLLDHNKKVKPEANKPDEKPSTPTVEEPSETMVGKSTFDFDEAMRETINRAVRESVARVMPDAIEKLLGDVKLKDVEFVNAEDAPTKEEIAKEEGTDQTPFVPAKDKQMSAEQEAAAFDDVRISDVEPDEVSAPSASGASMEDIEESINIAVNENSTLEEKARAGKILEKLLDTDLMDRYTPDEEIYRNILICVKESVKTDVKAETPTKSTAKQPKPKPVAKRQTTVVISTNLDDFDPADLLK